MARRRPRRDPATQTQNAPISSELAEQMRRYFQIYEDAGPGSRPIGSLNGLWSRLLRIMLVVAPIIWTLFLTVDLPWRIWVTRQVFFASTQASATQKLAETVATLVERQQRDYRELQKRISAMPPTEWRDRVSNLEEFDRANRQDHARIMISLEAIKSRLGLESDASEFDPSRLLPSLRRDSTSVPAFREKGFEHAPDISRDSVGESGDGNRQP